MKKIVMLGGIAILSAGFASKVSLAAAVTLNGLWDFRFEERKSLEEVRLPDFTAEDRMLVPGCWDVATKYFNQRGTGCYRRSFELAEDAANAILVVEGCALRARF